MSAFEAAGSGLMKDFYLFELLSDALWKEV